MKILYFAWIREKVGCESEEISLSEEIETVNDLIEWISSREPKYANAFSDLRAVRVAVNMEFAQFDKRIKNNDEIAFFPPITGG
tara:strand:- start:65221 stop:65472 length:252 start_codon:yes stop_codon:yes gene_type:complete